MRGFTRENETRPTGSRGPAESPSPLTLADVRDRVDRQAGLSKEVRQDLGSALRTMARVLGRELAELPAEPQYIRARLEDCSLRIAGLKPERWANVRSLVRRALTIAGLGEEYERKRAPFLPAWSDKLALLGDKKDQCMRWRLSALARHCSAMGILPDQVDDAVLAAYRAKLERTEFAKRPHDTHRTLCIAWNKAMDSFAGWPQQRVAVPQYRDWYSLEWDAFEQSLRDDLDRYLHYLSGKDVLTGCPEPLRPASIRGVKTTLRGYLSAIVRRGRDIATLKSLADAVEVETVKEGLRFFLARPSANGKPENKPLARKVSQCVLAMARYWVKADETHLAKLKEFDQRLKEKDSPQMGEKSRKRLEQFKDPKKVRELARLPQELIKTLPKTGTPSYREALRFQSAVAIEILLLAVLRMKNLAEIEIGKQLTWAAGKNGVMLLSIPGDEVKNGTPIVRPIPDKSARMIADYIERYRPVLLRQPSDHLFPGSVGGAKQQGHLSSQLSACIRRSTGLVMHAHLFRHFAAVTYLNAYPGQYGVIRLTHGHKHTATTTTFYCGTETDAAFRHFDAHLAALRGGERDGQTGNGKKRTKQRAQPAQRAKALPPAVVTLGSETLKMPARLVSQPA